MNRNPTKNNFRPTSLRRTGTARTVLLRMAADQERADRIRALKLERPDLTWRRIADHVGVSERAASDWQKKGGIEYANAAKLAALFEVDVDYIWRGTDTGTPTPFAGQDEFGDRLDRIEARQEDILNRLDQLQASLEAAISETVAAEAEEWRRVAQELVEGSGGQRGSQRAPARTPGARTKRAAASRTP